MKLGKVMVIMLALFIVLGFATGCSIQKAEQSNAKETAKIETTAPKVQGIILATTTSTEQTGLLDAIVPKFTEETGVPVKVVAVGTGQALEMGKNGEADVLLVHAKSSEEAFVKEGYGIARFDVMYNDFVLLGAKPLEDAYREDITSAFEHLAKEGMVFISRGDDSGTHKKELAIWKKAGIEPSGEWYVSAGKGMGEVIQMADEMKGYTLSDRGTYLSMRDKVDLKIVTEKAKDLLNQYGVIVVNPDKNPEVHLAEAQQFSAWIRSKAVQDMIGEFGVKEFGEPLFVPNAKE